MIGGIIILLVAIWMYQAAIQAKKENAFIWVAIGAAVFFVAQYFLVNLNVYVLEAVKDSQSGGMLDDRPLTSIKQDDMGSVTAFFFSMFMEFMPPFGGVVAAAFVRTIFVLKQPVTLGNLFSGIKEMFSKIGNSFKTTEK